MTREREWKFDLGSEAAAARLEKRLGSPVDARLQENRFFDTRARDLRRERWALRLRAEWLWAAGATPPDGGLLPARVPERVILSLKGPREGAGALHERREEQVQLRPELWRTQIDPASHLPASWRGLLPAPCEALDEVVRFTNLRRTFRFGARWRAQIDRTHFGPGRRVWELELEIAPADDAEVARIALASLFDEAGVAAREQERSKLQRALDRA